MFYGHIGDRLKQRFGITKGTLADLKWHTLNRGESLFEDGEATVYIVKYQDKYVYPVVLHDNKKIVTVLWECFVDSKIRGMYRHKPKQIKKLYKKIREYCDKV